MKPEAIHTDFPSATRLHAQRESSSASANPAWDTVHPREWSSNRYRQSQLTSADMDLVAVHRWIGSGIARAIVNESLLFYSDRTSRILS